MIDINKMSDLYKIINSRDLEIRVYIWCMLNKQNK